MSAGEESRGIRQRFPYQCNKTKTSKTTRQRSLWSPRQRHHQSLWQAKTTFVRISCTSCPLSNWPLWDLFPLNIWEEDQASINRTSHHSRTRSDPHTHTSPPSIRTPLHRRLFFSLYCSSSVQEAIHHHHTRVGYYTTTVARTSINLVSFVLQVCRVSP